MYELEDVKRKGKKKCTCVAPLNNKSVKCKRDYENIDTGNTLRWEYRKLEGNRLTEHGVAWWECSVICVDLCPRGTSESIAM